MTRRDIGSTPWRDSDIMLACGAGIIGLITIVAAWFGSSGTAAIERQAAWRDLAVAGFAVFAIGNGMWLLRVRRAVGDRRRALVSLEVGDDIPAPPAAAPVDGQALVRAPGMRFVHRPDCPLVAGKDVDLVVRGDSPLCGVCRP